MRVLRQSVLLSDKEQRHYYKTKVMPTFAQMEPEMILFSYLLRGKCIGYGGLVHMDWMARRGEISFLLDTARSANIDSYQNEFSIFLGMLKRCAFEFLKLNRIYTECYDIRPWHIKVIERCGFKFEGRLRRHVRIGPECVDSLFHGLLREDYDG